MLLCCKKSLGRVLNANQQSNLSEIPAKAFRFDIRCSVFSFFNIHRFDAVSEALVSLVEMPLLPSTHAKHRQLIWVPCQTSERDVRLSRIVPMLNLDVSQTLLVSNTSLCGLKGIDVRQSARYLGQETQCLIYDAHAGFNPNVFAQLAGTLIGGGVLILLTPPIADWPGYLDPEYLNFCASGYTQEDVKGLFLTRLQSHLLQATQPSGQNFGHDADSYRVFKPASPNPEAGQEQTQIQTEQHLALTALLSRLSKPSACVVVSADRGRGKSALVGRALACLAQSAPLTVLVSAPERRSTSTLFDWANSLKDTSGSDPSLQINYCHPVELSETCPKADVLVIDEAAAIPAELLAIFLAAYKRIVFITTLKGYEGQGRGFALRFLKTLSERRPNWLDLKLTHPVRWAADDPLENLLNQTLLLDAQASEMSKRPDSLSPVCEWLDADQLCQSETLLREVVGVLIDAHYRTTPGDVRIMLDGPGLSFMVMKSEEQVVGVALLVLEKGIDDDLASAIWQGTRRPKGNLITQTLIAHEGWLEAKDHQGWRVMRIAIHPALQSQGYGAILLKQVIQQANALALDYCATSFGSTPALLRFWGRQGFFPLRLGDQRDSVTAEWPVMMYMPLSHATVSCIEAFKERFLEQLLIKVGRYYTALPPVMFFLLLQYAGVKVSLSSREYERIQGFIKQQRSLESSVLELRRFVLNPERLAQVLALPLSDIRLIYERILCIQPAQLNEKKAGRETRRSQLQQLRAIFADLHKN
ncbi:tRNA(Met) cytidine acetyltransferase TmcA [Nitrincola nitratireducens]|uniref:tRNA(Met) cytidine acetyltransferase TmcA n=1 Tax=Nitrincola nitratireducens TaxID=1229521 RepID=W9V219_9GAMM|nr:tRNA(Met) cytidine acetyltransferase TmcA [Nitrincola nitratireducens]